MNAALASLASDLKDELFVHVKKFLQNDESHLQNQDYIDEENGEGDLNEMVINMEIDRQRERIQQQQKLPIFNLDKLDENFALLRKKGIYPYEYMDAFDKFDEKNLPPIEEFYSSLTLDGASENDYDHAKLVSG